MKRKFISTFCLALLASLFYVLPTQSQVTIGGLTPPEAGAILDLNSVAKGGLLLPQVELPDLSKIPASFIGINEDQDENLNLRGTLVYNIDPVTGPGIFMWDGYNWGKGWIRGSLIIQEDPNNVTPFPSDGSTTNYYTVSDQSCNQSGTFSFAWVAGAEFIEQLIILDAGAGRFSVKFQENDRASSRQAFLMITDACGNTNIYVFSQDGDQTGCGTTPTIPAIQTSNSTVLCGNGAAYLYLDNYSASGVYIWTLNGNEVGRGPNYIATQPGKYTVYGDKIGCSNSSSIQINISSTVAPEAPRMLIITNNGAVCGATGTTELILFSPPSGNIVWFKNGVKQDNPTYNGKTSIDADAGTWWAIIEENDCSSLPSESAFVYVDNSNDVIPMPEIKINGQTSNWQVCKSSSLYLEVSNFDQNYTYTWYINNTQIGIGNGVYYQIPADASNIVLRLRTTGTGCAKEANSQIEISPTNAPSIPLIIGNSSLCGGITSLSVNTQVVSPGVVWYKNGSVIQGQTGLNLLVTEPGNYSATVSDNGCVSPMSVVRPVTLSDFTILNWIREPQDAYFGDQKTFQVTGTSGPVTYTWTIMQGSTDITTSSIRSGQGSDQILIQLPSDDTSGNQVQITVRGNNACGQDITYPILQKSINLSDLCPTPLITSPQTAQTINVIAGNQATMTVMAANLNQASYQWYKGATGDISNPVGNNSPTFIYTPTLTGNETYWCRVSNGCGTNADSPVFNLNISGNPDSMTPGSGTLTGKVCFDIAESNFGGGCGTASVRAGLKANFASMPVSDKTYTFTAKSSGTNFQFVVVDAEKALDETTPYTAVYNFSGGSFSSGNTATIQLNFKTNLNSSASNPKIVGRTRDQAAYVKLYAVWTTSSVNYSVPLTISIQDCICCGAKISPTQWKAFLCYNLGADQSIDPFTPAEGLNGDYYQWGYPDLSALANANPNGFPYTWKYPEAATNSWQDNVKAENDPCPQGYRVPTRTEWQGVMDNNTPNNLGNWADSPTNFSSGIKFGESLYLPAAGYRSTNGGGLMTRGLSGYYWSTSFSRTSVLADGPHDMMYQMRLQQSSRTITDSYKSQAFTVRCIAE